MRGYWVVGVIRIRCKRKNFTDVRGTEFYRVWAV